MNPFSILTSKIYAGLAIFFLSLALIQTVRIEGFLFIDGYKETLASRDKTIADIAAAQEEFKRAQSEANHAPVIKSQAIAEKSNVEAPAYYRSVAAAADANRVRSNNPCPVNRADLSRADSAVEGVHGPVATPEMVSRPKSEDDQIVAAAGRAAEMRQEALDLIAAGAAVPAPDL